MKKKYLLFFMFLSCSVFAEDVRSNHSYKNLGFTQLPMATVNGYFNFNISTTRQRDEYYSKTKIRSSIYYNENNELQLLDSMDNRFAEKEYLFDTEATIIFKVNGINDFGVLYGGVFEINANSTHANYNDNINTNKSYFYMESFLGKIEAGAEQGVTKKMKVDAGTIARGTGGISGKYINYVNLPSISREAYTGYYPSLFILKPELPTSHGGYAIGYNNFLYICDINADGIISTNLERQCVSKQYRNENFYLNFESMETAVKLSYYTPEIYGLQLGVSYTPDTGNRGVSRYIGSKFDVGDLENVLEYGATFKQSIRGLNFTLSFTGEEGKTQTKSYEYDAGTNVENIKYLRNDLKAYQYGAVITYYGLSVAGSIGNWGRSLYYRNDLLDETINEEKSTFRTAGISYEFEGFNISATFFDSHFQKNKYVAKSIGLDYVVATGFIPYIEFTSFEFKPTEQDLVENKGWVLMGGVLLNF